MAVKFNKNFNINRLIKRIIFLIVGLLIGGLILAAFVDAFRGYCSVLFNGLSIIGVNVTTWASYGANNTATAPALQSTCVEGTNHIIGSNGNFNSGVLTVVGLMGVAGIVMAEFVRW